MDHLTENLENKESDDSTNLVLTSNPSASVSKFSSEPQQTATFRTVDDNVMDEDDESSEDEDYDHSEHFYQIAKKQYEDILARDPSNAEIKEKLATLVYAHDYSNKRQRTK